MIKCEKNTSAYKNQVALEVLTGVKSTAMACTDYHLKPQSLTRWKSEFLKQAPSIFSEYTLSPNDEAQQRTELAGLIQWLGKKLGVSTKAP
jgi:transposase